jgi:ribosomal protein RSM22 (predicted rRNA methylase)
MRLPDYLSTAVQQASSGAASTVAAASRELTHRYKSAKFTAPVVHTSTDRSAYLAVRFPATFSANLRVFSELLRLAPNVPISSLLDLGAGPGTSMFAAAEVFSGLISATLVEADPQWLRLGKQFADQSPHAAVRDAHWLQQDLRDPAEFETHDAVIISYALGELASAALEQVLRRAWRSTKSLLVLIEPGTRRGFAAINSARSFLIEQGAAILAPCPHRELCPMAAAGDWCHFSQRLERTAEHRRIKGGTLSYEDEKFSYLIATRLELAPAQARIVRHPQKRSGHVQLELCTENGVLEKRTVTKSNQDPYKRARHAEWGDEWQDLGRTHLEK